MFGTLPAHGAEDNFSSESLQFVVLPTLVLFIKSILLLLGLFCMIASQFDPQTFLLFYLMNFPISFYRTAVQKNKTDELRFCSRKASHRCFSHSDCKGKLRTVPSTWNPPYTWTTELIIPNYCHVIYGGWKLLSKYIECTKLSEVGLEGFDI